MEGRTLPSFLHFLELPARPPRGSRGILLPFSFLSTLSLFCLISVVSCTGAPGRETKPSPAPAPVRIPGDPQEKPVFLEAAPGWTARLLWAGDVGIWTAEILDVIPPSAGPEVTALDDKGRCVLLGLDSNKVSLWQPVMDGRWLGAVARMQPDPRDPWPELFVGGERGNLYRVKPLPQGGFDARVIAYFPGKEIHTLFAADLNPLLPGRELYACLSTGEVFLVDRPRSAGGAWKTVLVYKDPGRIRDAVVYPAPEGAGEDVVCVSRSGRAVRLYRSIDGVAAQVLYTSPQGLSRVDLRLGGNGEPVLYVGGDDGKLLRFQEFEGGTWTGELVYAGPPGLRGVAAGRVDADPSVETVAVFGYSREVVILRRTGEGVWEEERVFTAWDKGHWLCAGEVDDRNGTDELVLSGYGARVVLLSRPPGYGSR